MRTKVFLESIDRYEANKEMLEIIEEKEICPKKEKTNRSLQPNTLASSRLDLSKEQSQSRNQE
jgi:hypothetical protein